MTRTSPATSLASKEPPASWSSSHQPALTVSLATDDEVLTRAASLVSSAGLSQLRETPGSCTVLRKQENMRREER